MVVLATSIMGLIIEAHPINLMVLSTVRIVLIASSKLAEDTLVTAPLTIFPSWVRLLLRKSVMTSKPGRALVIPATALIAWLTTVAAVVAMSSQPSAWKSGT